MKSAVLIVLIVSALTMTSRAWARPSPVSTAFTYQGQLKQAGNPVNNTADFQFTLWDAVSGPTQVGVGSSANGIAVANGVFTTQIDFGANAFNGQARWLEISVRTPAGIGSFTTLTPRQPLTAAPYALQTRGIVVDSSNNVGINTSAPTNKLSVIGNADVSGNLGIGTVSPGEKLTIAGSMEVGTGAGDYQHLRVGGGNSSGMLYGSFPATGDGVHLGYNFYYDAAGAAHVLNPGGGTSRLTVGYGFVELAAETFLGADPVRLLYVTPNNSYFTSTLLGIGTAAPAFLLHVNGSAGKPGGGSWSNSSDARLKKNIEPLQGALDQVMRLQGVTFEYIDPKAINELPGQRIGMIAQQVEQVFPDWVEQRKDGYKTVTYRGFEALTVEALRDLRAEKDGQIAALQHENQELQDRLASLEKTVERIKNIQEEH